MEPLNNRFRPFRATLQGVVWFSYFVGATLIIGMVFPLMVLLVPRKHRAVRIRKVVTLAFRSMTFLARLFRLIGQITVTGYQYLPKDGCYLLASNHPSFYDVILLISLFPGANCIVNRKLLEKPFYGIIIRLAGYIPNNIESYKGQIQRYMSEESMPLIIFPEGTRSTDSINPFQRGCARLALENNLPVIPIYIRYSQTFMKKGTPWYYSPPQAPDIIIEILPEQKPAFLTIGEDQPITIKVRHFNQQLEQFFKEITTRGIHAQ